MTNIYLSPEQVAILQELKDRGSNEDGNYSDVYTLPKMCLGFSVFWAIEK